MERRLDLEAWKRVKANKGSAGIDGMSVGAFPDFCRKHWPRISTDLMAGNYRPAPVHRVFIPKPDGSKRPLGVPTVLDRMIQQAVGAMESGWKEGRRHAVDCDLKSFFDTVNHDKLMASLREKRGHAFARYADDFIILVRSAKAAQRIMSSVVRFCEGRLKLIVSRARSRAALLKTCTFLGYRTGYRGKLMWASKALLRFKQRVREITRRNRGHREQDVINELRLYIRSWLNYYKLSCTYIKVLGLGEWGRRRVRLYYWKQWKQPRTRRRHLPALGVFPERVHMASRSRKGYWRRSNNSLVRLVLNNRLLEGQGAPDMREIWIALHYPEQRCLQEV